MFISHSLTSVVFGLAEGRSTAEFSSSYTLNSLEEAVKLFGTQILQLHLMSEKAEAKL